MSKPFDEQRISAANWIGIDPDRIEIAEGSRAMGFCRYRAKIQGPIHGADAVAVAEFLNERTPKHIIFSVEIKR